MDDLSKLIPLIAEPVGVAALFGLAIWAGLRVLLTAIAAAERVEHARIGVQSTMAEAIKSQAAGAASLAQAEADLRREMQEQSIILRIISQRVGLAPKPDNPRHETEGE